MALTTFKLNPRTGSMEQTGPGTPAYFAAQQAMRDKQREMSRVGGGSTFVGGGLGLDEEGNLAEPMPWAPYSGFGDGGGRGRGGFGGGRGGYGGGGGFDDAVTGGFGALPALPGRIGYRGSLENSNPGMGTLDTFDSWNAGRSGYSGTGTAPAAPGGSGGGSPLDWVSGAPSGLAPGADNPFAPPVATPMNPLIQRLKDIIPWMGGGGPVQEGSPVVVGDTGPELFVPESDGTIVPNGGLYAPTDEARRRRAALKAGNIKGYLASLMV